MLPKPEINFQRTPVTLITAAVAVALEIVCWVDDPRRLMYYNEFLGILPRIWAGQLWRPFTSALMHADPIHAVFNVYWLVIFGPALEHRLGSYRTLGLVLLLGYVSMMPEYVIGSYRRDEPIMIVGLSGIVYGLFGILWVGRRFSRELEAVCNNQTAFVLFAWFVLCILMTYAGRMNVANIAHAGGLGFGVLYGSAIFDVRARLRWTIVASVSSGLVLSTLIACPGHRGYEHVKHGRRLWWSEAPRRSAPIRTAGMELAPAAVARAITSALAAASAGRPTASGCRCRRCAPPGSWGPSASPGQPTPDSKALPGPFPRPDTGR